MAVRALVHAGRLSRGSDGEVLMSTDITFVCDCGEAWSCVVWHCLCGAHNRPTQTVCACGAHRGNLEFAEALCAARAAAEYSQRDIVALLGIPQPRQSEWENGIRLPNRERFRLLRDAFPELARFDSSMFPKPNPGGGGKFRPDAYLFRQGTRKPNKLTVRRVET